jgi:hypothetical protein
MDKDIFPDLAELGGYFDSVTIRPLQVPSDCIDGFLAAFWKRPEAYLSNRVRQAMSPFSRIRNVAEGLQKLNEDLASGVWASNNHVLLGLSHLDVGYRVISAKVRNA